jgi:hypothetical protein
MECAPKPHGAHASWQKTTAATELPESTDEWPGYVLISIFRKEFIHRSTAYPEPSILLRHG